MNLMTLRSSNLRLILLIGTVLLVGSAWGQAWVDSYDKALKAASENDWAGARSAFMEAVVSRPDDQANATFLPGPVTEPRRWRSGLPYSPNFGAAYSAYRLAAAATDSGDQTKLYETVVAETQALVAKGQSSPETVHILKKSLEALKQADQLAAVSASLTTLAWKVDTSFVAPGDIMGPVKGTGGGSSGSGKSSQGNSGSGSNGTNSSDPNSPVIIPIGAAELPTFRDKIPTGNVASLPNKYALVIGNSETKITDYAVPFASNDSMTLVDSLTTKAGYMADNVTLVQNGTTSQIMDAAKALAERLPADATVTLYFSGVAVSMDGKDYLAGTNTGFASDLANMISKTDLYNVFLSKGAKVFAFYQTDRSMVDGNYFGKERLPIGMISEVHATIAGQKVFSMVRGDGSVGIYTNAFVEVLNEFMTNQVPLDEFCWQVFNHIRRGKAKLGGGGSYQIPTLPVYTNMGSESAKF